MQLRAKILESMLSYFSNGDTVLKHACVVVLMDGRVHLEPAIEANDKNGGSIEESDERNWKPGGRGYSQKNWVGVCDPLPKTLTLFMTKICVLPYPNYDLTKHLIPYL